MAEDWKAVGAEVDAALRSIGDISEPNGHPAVIRKAGAGAPVNPWDPPGGTPTHHQVVVLISDDELRDINGTLIGQTKRTVTISGAAGVVPHDDDEIALGMTVDKIGDDTQWHGIEMVKPLAPAGVAVLYDLLLAG
jgi:hypothetical protein